ncbi:uncharacterized protein LOC119067721 [Bradysia coprophila]|uniref:uncharacterized protein LOC119067721 n=1 Tax=Bradysia coprophila TaxID=38358 RepID=UPI00187DD5FC|nr:uncharacterized protein LOC119067721 [Bradysia coprophila]
MKTVNILYVALLVAVITIAQCEEEAPKKTSALLRRAAGRNTFTKTTTTTSPPLQDEYQDEIDENGEYIDDQGAIENGDASTTTTTTEPAKKIGPIIRPFRSNDDLLSALKRRQQNMKSIKKVTSKPYVEEEQEKEVAPVSPSKLNANNKPIDRHSINAKKNRFGGGRVSSVVASEQHDTQPPAEEVTPQPTVKRPARSRFGFNRSN